jgi:hypothetical protein
MAPRRCNHEARKALGRGAEATGGKPVHQQNLPTGDSYGAPSDSSTTIAAADLKLRVHTRRDWGFLSTPESPMISSISFDKHDW